MAMLPKLDSTKELNRRAVLELIRERDDLSRRELVEAAALLNLDVAIVGGPSMAAGEALLQPLRGLDA